MAERLCFTLHKHTPVECIISSHVKESEIYLENLVHTLFHNGLFVLVAHWLSF